MPDNCHDNHPAGEVAPLPSHPLTPPSPVVKVSEPLGGLPDVIATPSAFHAACAALDAGTGPVAIDVERASSFRYSNRAYLIQIHREQAGTFLFDPLTWDSTNSCYAGIDASPLRQLLSGQHSPLWVVHAAHQDLPSLAREGFRPQRLFDTELAGRLMGFPRVALAVMTERLLCVGLEKGFSAVDWSRRPLPHPWLNYAALDVQFLVPLHHQLAEHLHQTGKDQWADEEFDWLVQQAKSLSPHTPTPERSTTWRRTSGIHRVRNRRDLAVVRQLWMARDAIASATDTAAWRLLHDTVVIETSLKKPLTRSALLALPTMRATNSPARHHTTWLKAVHQALQLEPDQWPELSPTTTALPATGLWRKRHPQAAARLAAAREHLGHLNAQHSIPVENLLPPDALKQAAWQEYSPTSNEEQLAATITSLLRQAGARQWQITLSTPALVQAFRSTTPDQQERKTTPCQ